MPGAKRSVVMSFVTAQKLSMNALRTCVEIKILRRVLNHASSATPSTRRLLDGVAMPVPHRSTEPVIAEK